MKTARSKIESGVDQFSENPQFWLHLKALRTLLHRAQSLTNNFTEKTNVERGIATYFLDGGLELINVFLSHYFKFEKKFNEHEFVLRKIIEYLKVHYYLVLTSNFTFVYHPF